MLLCYLVAEDEQYQYSQVDIVAQEEGDEWLDWIVTLDIDEACFPRAMGIRGFCPRLGV